MFSLSLCGLESSSCKAIDFGLTGPGSIPGVGEVKIFLHSFVTRLVVYIQPPIK